MRLNKGKLKEALGQLPFLPEVYWRIFYRGRPLSRKASLQSLQKQIPQWKTEAQAILNGSSFSKNHRRRILLFSSYKLWLQHSALLAMALACLGNSVTLAFLPFSSWRQRLSNFSIRIQNAYIKGVLANLLPYVKVFSLYEWAQRAENGYLPDALDYAVQQVTLRDTQYTLQIENFDLSDLESEAGRLYALRLEQNRLAAQAALRWLETERPDVVLIPNGSILEFGAFYQVARFLEIPTVTYEFGEQRQRIWIAQNDEVMLQNTEAIWRSYASQPFLDEQRRKLAALFQSRTQADLWGNFSRRWQEIPRQGVESARSHLALETKPVVLLATNVIGDSLTLNRQVFSQNMTEWIERTVQFFVQHSEVDLMIRIHPGERYTRGPSVKEIVASMVPELPPHFRLIGAEDPVNTYDLIELATLGLVYTTTTGLEMAMSGLPVIVGGKTHYRHKGFTFDPATWEDYFNLLEKAVSNPQSLWLSPEQVETAWHYAYVFFFEYPMPFPWHLHLRDDLAQWPLSRVCSEEGMREFGATFSALCGEVIG